MRYLILPLIYLLAFLPPLAGGSWRTLLRTFCIGLGMLLGAVLLAGLGGGFIVFVFSFAIAAALAGFLAGCATKAILLATRTPPRTMRFGLAALAGFLAVPAALLGLGLYGEWASRAVYAALPTTESLPLIAACEPFRSPDRLLDSVLASAPQTEQDALPALDTHLRYPSTYLEPFRPRFPVPMQRQSQMRFHMHIADASPVGQDENKDAEGRWLPPGKREPSTSFRLLSRPPVARHASRVVRIGLGEVDPSDSTPDLTLSQSAYPGLQLVLNEAASPRLERDRFVAMRDGSITAFVECRPEGQVPNPTCEFLFDHRGVPVDGRFPRSSLSGWPGIKRDVTNFLDCTLVSQMPAG